MVKVNVVYGAASQALIIRDVLRMHSNKQKLYNNYPHTTADQIELSTMKNWDIIKNKLIA